MYGKAFKKGYGLTPAKHKPTFAHGPSEPPFKVIGLAVYALVDKGIYTKLDGDTWGLWLAITNKPLPGVYNFHRMSASA